MKSKGISATAFANRLDELGIMSRSQAMRFFVGTHDTVTVNADAMFLTLAKMKRKDKS